MSPQYRNRQTRIAGIFLAIFCLLTIAGWMANSAVMVTLGIPGNITMKLNSAIGMLLAAIGLMGLSIPGKEINKVGLIVSVAVILIGALTLLQYITGADFGIDNLILQDRITNTRYPGRMSPVTAMNLTLTGLGLLFMYLQKWQQMVQLISIVLCSFSIIIIISYAFQLNYRTTIPFFNSMALQTAVLFILIGLSFFSAPSIFTPKFPFEWKLLASIGFIILIMLSSYFLINKSNEDFINSSSEVEHTRDVIFEAEQIRSSYKDMELSTRAFALTGDSSYKNNFDLAVDSTIHDLEVLKQLTKTDSSHQIRIIRLQNMLKTEFQEGITSLKLKQPEKKIVFDSVNNLLTDIEDAEYDHLAAKKQVYTAKVKDAKQVGLVFVGLTMLMLFTIYLLVQSNQRARNRAVAELKESEEWFSTTLSSIGDGVIVVNENKEVIFMNPVAHSLTKWGKEAYGRTIGEIFPTVHEVSRKELSNPINEALVNKKVIALSNHAMLIRKDHSEINIDNSAAPIINDDGSISGVVLVFRDVTEAKKREVQNRYNSILLENISDAIISTDTQFTIKTWNQAAEEMYGYRAAEVIGKPLGEIIDIKGTEQAREEDLAKLHENDFFKDEYEVNSKSGDTITILASVNVIRNKEQEISGYVAVHKNITERKKALERINYLARLVEQTSDAIFSIDQDFNIISWNQGAEQMYGYSRTEVIGKNALRITRTAYTQTELENITKAIDSFGQWSGDGLHQDRSGNPIHVYTSISPVKNSKNENLGSVLIVRNITEKKKLEEQLRNFNSALQKQVAEKTAEIKEIFDRVNDGFIAFDRQWNFTFVNKKAGEIYRLPPENLVGKNVWEVFPSAVGSPFYKACMEAIETQSYVLIEDYSDIFDYWYESHIYPSKAGISVYFKDITEKKKSQDAILREKVFSEKIIESLPGIFYLFDKKGKFLWWNKHLENITGYTAEQIEGMHPADFFGSRVRQEVIEKMEEVLQHGSSESEGYLRTKDAKKIPFYFTGTYVEYNGIPCLLGTGIDISERKKAEKILENSIERFEMIGKTTNDAVWEWDMVYDVHWANEMHQDLYGVTNKDEIPPIEEWEQRLHPDDKTEVLESLKKTLDSTENAWIAEYRFYRGAKKEECINIYDRTYIVRDKEGKPIRMMGSMVDITARKIAEENLKKNEEKYRLLFSSSPLPMWVYDINNFSILDVNEAAIRQYGYSRAKFLEMTIKDLRPKEDVERLVQYSKIENPGVRQTGVWRHLKNDGSIIDVEVNSHDIFFNGRMSRLVLANDITEKLKSEKIILEASEQLRNLSARLQEIREEERMHMAHEIHDELGQRLTVLKMDISWLKRYLKEADQSTREKLEGTLELLDGTIKIVRRIATDLRPGILDDLGLIPALEWQSKDFENRSGIKVSFKSNISEIAMKTELATGIFRIYQESLTNVGRHADASEIESVLVKNGNKISLSIKDNGKGFDTATLGTKKTLGITGMKERTVMLGGEYYISSNPGQGTEITVMVPLPKD